MPGWGPPWKIRATDGSSGAHGTSNPRAAAKSENHACRSSVTSSAEAEARNRSSLPLPTIGIGLEGWERIQAYAITSAVVS